MFCENCGHQVREGERFCEACGAPLQPVAPVQPAQQQAEQPAQPFEQPAQQPIEQPAQPFEQPAQPNPFDAPTQQYTPTPAQPAPKKPMSKKTKMILLICGIGAAVLTAFLIVLFTAIIPAAQNAGKLDLKDYIIAKFDNVYDSDEVKQLSDGKINGWFTVDVEKFIKEQKLPEDTDPYDTALMEFYNIADIRLEKKTGEVNPEDYSNYFYGAKQDDVFTVIISWPTEGGALAESYKRQLAGIESRYGVGFKTENVSFDVKLADELSREGITVLVPQETDLLGYIKKNNLIETKGDTDGRLSVSVKKFETTIGDFVFKHDSDSTSVEIYDKNNKHIDNFYLEFSDTYRLKNGDTVTLGYDNYYVNYLVNKGIALTGEKITYTVSGSVTATTAPATTAPAGSTPAATTPATTAPAASTPSTQPKEEGMTAAEAKANAGLLKGYLMEYVYENDSKAKQGDKIDIKNIYYCHSTDSSYRRIVFIYENTTGKYFRALETAPEYLTVKNGKLDASMAYFSESDPGKTLAEATENNWYLSETYRKFYDITKIL